MHLLNQRSRELLSLLMAEFIRTGVPIASKRLAEISKLNLSSATIRSELKSLEAEGYLEQPHTSAGRRPTLLAFRLFIDSLMKRHELPEKSAAKIKSFFADAQGEKMEPIEQLREAARFLSELSGAPSILFRRPVQGRVVKTLRFIATGDLQLLSVAVLSDGSVENRFVALEEPLARDQLERLHHLLDEALGDRNLEDIRDYLGRVTEDSTGETRALSQWASGMVNASNTLHQGEVVIEGRSQLLRQFNDQRSTEKLLALLDDRSQFLELLNRTIAVDDVQVFLGGDPQIVSGAEEMSPASTLSLVLAPISPSALNPESLRSSTGASASAFSGSVGIVGSAIMDYPKLMPLVRGMAQALSDALEPTTMGLVNSDTVSSSLKSH